MCKPPLKILPFIILHSPYARFPVFILVLTPPSPHGPIRRASGLACDF